MKYEANIYQMIVESHTFWVAESKVLKGCVGQGETSAEAITELEANEDEWIETAKEVGIPVPPVTVKELPKHNGKFALRLSPNIYSDSAEISKDLGISLNQHFCNAIIAYNSDCKKYLYKQIPDVADEKIISFHAKTSRRISHEVVEMSGIEELEEM